MSDETRKEQLTDHSWLATAIDTMISSSRFGACEQPNMIKGMPNPLAFTKAIHKAQRNVIKQLLPVLVIREVLLYYFQSCAESSYFLSEFRIV